MFFFAYGGYGVKLGLRECWSRGGRKDAFPGADGSTITQDEFYNATTKPIYGLYGNILPEGNTGIRFIDITSSGVINGNNSQIYSIKHPLSYIYNTIEPYDWYTTTGYRNDNLWNSTYKSNYDPCPVGWRIPANGTWSDFSITTAPYYSQGIPYNSSSRYATNGRLYYKMVWYSLAGYRNFNDGALLYIGYYGFIWASTTDNVLANYVHLRIDDVNPNFAHPRSYGFSVRCVQE